MRLLFEVLKRHLPGLAFACQFPERSNFQRSAHGDPCTFPFLRQEAFHAAIQPIVGGEVSQLSKFVEPEAEILQGVHEAVEIEF